MQSGSMRLFRIAGITVYLHFSWFLVAVYQLTSRPHGYYRPIFAVYEYLLFFCIVLLHEFGHALACRSVGGFADRILLWPFGGIAFVRPPARAGAQLWSIVAGPLVNVALIPLLLFLRAFLWRTGLAGLSLDTYQLISSTAQINLIILVFNLLPVYPLDGGQILRSLLWYVVGPITSLRIASVIGLIGAIGFVIFGLTSRSMWLALLAFFLLSQAVQGWRHAQALQQRHNEASQAAPPPQEQRPPIL